MNATEIKFFSKYEKVLGAVYYDKVLFNAKRVFLNAMADKWETMHNVSINRNWSCSHCAFNFLEQVAREYFGSKETVETEIKEKQKPKKNGTGKKKLPNKNKK